MTLLLYKPRTSPLPSDLPSKAKVTFLSLENDRFSEFNLNLLQLDSEQLGIPDTEYSSVVTLNSSDFSRICKELSNLAETSNDSFGFY